MIKNYSFLFSYFQKTQFPNILKISFFLLLFSNISYGQLVTTIDFETENSGYTLSNSEGSTFTDVFNRIDRTGNPLGGNSSFLFAIEDTNIPGESIQLATIDVSGSASFTFSIDMLAHHYNDWDNTDELLITYSVDGGGDQNLMWVQSITDPNNSSNEPAALDTNFDGDGECANVLPAISTGTGALGCIVPSSDFATFITSSIALSSNSTLDIKLQFKGLTSADEGIYIDNIIITETTASSDPSVTFDAATSAVDETDADVVTIGIPVTLTNYAADVTITPTVNGSSSAESGDYTIDLAPLTFSGNETKYIPLTIKDDADFDDETIIIDFTVTSGTADLGTSNHTITITDNESPPVPSIIISEVTDPKDQYSGRFVEIYNNGATDINLATEQIYIAIQSNGGTVSSTALSGILAANEVMIIGNSSNINTYYGFDADKDYGSITGNGDDGYFLYHGGSHSSGTLIDSYGVLGQDGTGETWEYLDSRAYRNSPKSTSPNATWTQAEWTVESTDKNLADMTPGALEDEYRYDGDWKPRDVYSNASSTDDVYISSSVTLTDNLTVTNFEIETGQIATINSGGSLIVSGTSSGNVTYNRTIDFVDGNLKGWYLLSSPVVGQDYNDDYVTANDIASNGTNRGIATYTTASDSWAYHQGAGSGSFSAGRGYSLKRQTNTGTVSFTGTLNTNDAGVDVTLDNTGERYNLLGNPYTSSISSATLLGNGALSETQTIWIYDQTSGTNGAYAVSTLVDNFILAPGQGFFVKANEAGGTVNFAETNQSHSADTFQKSANTEIKLKISVDGFQNYAKIYYLDKATKGFDVGYEGEIFGGSSDSFSIYSQLLSDNIGKKYQVQSLPNSDFENMVIPIGVKAAAGKEITLTADALNLPEGIKVFLEDREENTFTRLDELNASYKINTISAINGVGRFYLHTTQSVLNINDAALDNVSVFNVHNSLRIVGLQQGKATVKLFNVLGRQVLNTAFESNGTKDISLPSLAKGVYIVQLETVEGKLNKKIILE